MVRRVVLGFLFVLLSVAVVSAQDAICNAPTQAALDAAFQACRNVGHGVACYGGGDVSLTTMPDADAVSFAKPGDQVALDAIEELSLRSNSDGDWGLVRMEYAGRLARLTVLAFGDVTLKRVVDTTLPPVLLKARPTAKVNVRGGPSTSDSVVTSLATDQVVTADGRNETSDWLRVQLSNSGSVGWVFAELLTVDGDMATLPVLSADDKTPIVVPPTYEPMQKFTLETTSSSSCDGTVTSGLLVQTAFGTRNIHLVVNGALVNIGSTLAFSTVGDTLAISVIDGQADVFGTIAPTGTRIRLTLDDALKATGETIFEAIDAESLNLLPLALLPHQVSVPEPLSKETIAELTPIAAVPGRWTSNIKDSGWTDVCPGYARTTGSGLETGSKTFVLEAGESPLDYPLGGGPRGNPQSGGNSQGVVVARIDSNHITFGWFDAMEGELGLVSPTRAEGVIRTRIFLGDRPDVVCWGLQTLVMEYAGE